MKIPLSTSKYTRLIVYAAVSVLLANFFLAAKASAATTSWTSSTDGLWQDSANWDNGAPQIGDEVIIENYATSKVVTVDAATPLENLDISSLKVWTPNTLRLINQSSELKVQGIADVAYGGVLWVDGGNFNGRLSVNDSATLRASAGSVLTNRLDVHGQPGQAAKVDVTGGNLTSSGDFRVGSFGGTSGEVAISGGSVKVAGVLYLGSTGDSDIATLEVSNTGLFEAGAIILAKGAGSSSITIKDGGALQFNSSAPSISTSGAGWSIALSSGVIAYRDVVDADINNSIISSKVDFFGNNAFRLNNSANDTNLVSYTFDAGENASHQYQSLELTGAASIWTTTGTTTIGANGAIRISDSGNAGLNASIQNFGTIAVTNSQTYWQKDVVVSGSYASDGASTSTFSGDVSVGSNGVLVGQSGAKMVFQSGLNIASTNTNFDLSISTAQFSTGSDSEHIVNLTGSGSLDQGASLSVPPDFLIGTLKIDLNNTLALTGASGVNALYIGTLDLSDWDITGPALDGSLSSAFDLSAGINVYYDSNLASNSFLGGGTYDLWSGGQLIAFSAIPEPSVVALLLTCALLFLGVRRARCAGQRLCEDLR